MKKWASVIKIVLTIAVASAAMFLMTGCADLDTVLTLGSGFNGTREMDVVVSASDMRSYVEGGVEAMKNVVNVHMPAPLTCDVKEIGGVTHFVFTLTFDGREDYQQKVQACLDANPENTLTANVFFESTESEFKKGFALRENFRSDDILAWFGHYLAAGDVISYSGDYDDWYYSNSVTIHYEGSTYSASPYSAMDVDEMEYLTFSMLLSTTRPLLNGKFERTLEFFMDTDTEQKLVGNGVNLEAYFQALLPEGAELTIEDASSGDRIYKITFACDTTEDLVANTNQILRTEDTAFDIQVTPDSSIPGRAAVVVNEYMDGSYYLRYSYVNPLYSCLVMFPGCAVDTVQTSVTCEVGQHAKTRELATLYSIELNTPATLYFDWTLAFETAELELALSGKIGAKLHLALPIDAEKYVQDMAEELLKASMIKGVSFKTSKDKDAGHIVYTVDFGKDKSAELEVRMNEFAALFGSGRTGLTSFSPFSLSYAKTSGNRYVLHASCLFEMFTGTKEGEIVVTPGFLFKLESSLKEGEKEQRFASSYSYATCDVYAKGTNVVVVAFIAVLVLALIAGGVLLLVKMQKNKTPQPAGAYGQQPQSGQPVQYGQQPQSGQPMQYGQQPLQTGQPPAYAPPQPQAPAFGAEQAPQQPPAPPAPVAEAPAQPQPQQTPVPPADPAAPAADAPQPDAPPQP